VTDVRNAVLGIDCLDTKLIANADVECGIATAWSLYVDTNNAAATISDSDLANTFTGTKAIEINVTAAGASINKVLLKNSIVSDSELSDKKITLKTNAKASNGSNQNFKLRLKITNSSDVVSYAVSNEIDLTTAYKLYELEAILPENVKSIEFQVLCGKAIGTYYFDDFLSIVTDISNLSIGEDIQENNLVVFPNPVLDVLNFSETLAIVEVFNAYGQKMLSQQNKISIDVSSLKSGVYFLGYKTKNGGMSQRTFVKK